MSRRPPDVGRDPSPPSQPSQGAPRRAPRASTSASAAGASSAVASSSSSSSSAQPVHPPLISSSLGPGSSAAAMGIGLGRAPRQSQVRRTSRRASLDPYPSSAGAAAGSARQDSPETARRPSRVDRVVERAEEEPRAGRAERGADIEMSLQREGVSNEGERTFELVVLQQPQIGAEAGLGKNTLGRLPIVPAPVVEVIVNDRSGERTDVELPYLFCSCSLRQEDGVSPVEVAPLTDGSEDGVAEEFSALIGQLVRNPRRVEDLGGVQRSVFVFEDVSVRTKGSYKLEFRLGEARRPKSPKLAAVLSETFDVVDWQAYPGRPPSEIVTDLSMHLHQQGVPMYIPPLLLPQPGELAPPPPSSNPFPVNFSELDALAEVATSASSGQQPPGRPAP
ncbi:hypothetical protein JCM10449v2_005512 [Rhodotorula kratochvilovae]